METRVKNNNIKTTKTKATETTKCILCNTYFKGFGHNPEPLESNKFRCCDICNDTEVIPFRLYKLKQRKV